MVQQVLRLEIQLQRGITMLFENDRGADRSFKTVRFLAFDQFAKRPQRAAVVLAIVRQRTEVTLHFRGRVEPLNKSPLSRSEVFFVGNHRSISRLCSLGRQKP